MVDAGSDTANYLSDFYSEGKGTLFKTDISVDFSTLWKTYDAIRGLQELPLGEWGIKRAMNNAADRVRSHVVDLLKSRLSLDSSVIEEGVTIKYAEDAYDDARVQISKSPIPAIKYGATETEHGLQFKFDMSEGPRDYRAAFTATPTGATELGAYQRDVINGHRSGRLPIHEIYGPSIAKYFETNSGQFQSEQLYAMQIFQEELETAYRIHNFEEPSVEGFFVFTYEAAHTLARNAIVGAAVGGAAGAFSGVGGIAGAQVGAVAGVGSAIYEIGKGAF